MTTAMSNIAMMFAFPPSFHSLSLSIFRMSRSTIEKTQSSWMYQRTPMPLSAMIKYLTAPGTSCMESNAPLMDMLTYPWMN